MAFESLLMKLLSVIVLGFNKLRYRHRFRFCGYQNLKYDTKFNINANGLIYLKQISSHYNCHFCAVGGKLIIGKHVTFNRNCIVACLKKINIGNNVYIGPNVMIYDHNHKFNSKKVYSDKFSTGSILIEDNVWIGAGCIILRNTCIGKGSVIGAGCVIKGNIPPHSLVTNNNSLKIESIDNR